MKQSNRLKAAIRENRVAFGYDLHFPSTHIIEILGPLDFDFVWIDGEHGPFSLEQIEEICRAAELVGVTPIARVPNTRSSTILQYLDRGIQGILGPHINSKANAEQLVRACYFGPLGERSFGGNRGTDYGYGIPDMGAYYEQCNQNILVGALLEDEDVVENLDEILTVPGIDYFSIGPNDFAQGLGYPGGARHETVVEAMEAVYTRIKQAGRHVGRDAMASIHVKEMLTGSAKSFLERTW